MNEQVTQTLENVFTREPLGDIDRQALPSELIHVKWCQPPNLGKMPASLFLVAGTFSRPFTVLQSSARLARLNCFAT